MMHPESAAVANSNPRIRTSERITSSTSCFRGALRPALERDTQIAMGRKLGRGPAAKWR